MAGYESLEAAGDLLKAALRTIEGLSVPTEPTDTLRPPAALVGAPTFECEIGSEPSAAKFPLFVAVDANNKAFGRLMKLAPKITRAVEELMPDAVVTGGEPVTLLDNKTELPAYLFTVDVDL